MLRHALLPALLLCGAAVVQAQAPGQALPGGPADAPAPEGAPAPAEPAGPPLPSPGPGAWRYYLPIFDQYSFTEHPFQQITGDGDFSDGRSPLSTGFTADVPETDAQAGFLQKTLHTLPNFGVHYAQAMDTPFPRGISYGFDHARFTQEDDGAARDGTVPPILMDLYTYQGTVKLYAFDPTQPGLNYFFGVGIGILNGKVRADPFEDQSAETLNFEQNPFGTTRLGLETKGDNWGFTYELMVVNANDVSLDSNPYPDSDRTTLKFSGSLIRIALFYEFN